MKGLSRLLLITSLLASLPALSQTRIIDSLRNSLAGERDRSRQLQLLFSLCEERNSLSSDSLFAYAYSARKLTVASGRERFLADFYITSAVEKMGAPDSALAMATEKLRQLERHQAAADVYRRFLYLKGTTLLRRNEYGEAHRVFFDLLKQSEQAGDTMSQIAGRCGVGWAYMEMNQPVDAREWLLKSLHSTDDPRYARYLTANYVNLAAVNGMLERLDSVEWYADKAISEARRQQQLTYLSNGLNLKASLYMFTNRNALAERPLREALETRELIGDPFYVVADMAQIASYYANAGQPDQALAYSRKGIDLASQHQITGKLPMLYHALAEAYLAKKDLAGYNQAIEKHIALKDSLYQADMARSTAELEARYKLQKKENTIIQQQLTLVKQKYLITIIVLAVTALFIAAFFIFRTYRLRQHRRVAQMLRQEKELAAKAVSTAEERERKRIAADLHDNLGAYAASIAFNLEQLIQHTGQSQTAIAELRNNSQAMVAELSDTIWALKKDALYLTAISDRAKVFIQKLQSTYGHIRIDVEEEIGEDVLLSPSHAFHLLRIIQEAVNNAVKHSRCGRVVVHIRGGSVWSVVIKDDGLGMNAFKGSANGDGLGNMRRRADMSGWHINWASEAGRGTEVMIQPTTN